MKNMVKSYLKSWVPRFQMSLAACSGRTLYLFWWSEPQWGNIGRQALAGHCDWGLARLVQPLCWTRPASRQKACSFKLMSTRGSESDGLTGRVSLTRRPVNVVLRDSDARPMTLADLVVFAHFDVDKWSPFELDSGGEIAGPAARCTSSWASGRTPARRPRPCRWRPSPGAAPAHWHHSHSD